MAEPNATAQDAAHSPASSKSSSAGDGANRAGEPVVEAERRSFQAADRTGRAAADAAQQMAGAENRAVAETGRRIGEQARQSSHEVAEFWRSSFESMSSLQAELRQMMDEVWRRTTGFGPRAPMLTARPFALGLPSFLGQPAADVRETDDAYLLAIELPGLTREDVDVALRGDVLTVTGHKAEQDERAAGAYRISERRFGRFERSFPIPRDVDRGRVEAQVRDGVLKVVLHRSAEAPRQSQKIELKA